MKKANEMTDEEFAVCKEEWLEKHHTYYHKYYVCNDCGTHCMTHGRRTQAESEKDLLENYACLKCNSKNITGNNIVQKFRNSVSLSRGGPAIGIYEGFQL